uniref:Uncharacterized protein n=1 Tax=Athene cunicularia TaxID=194338 RepID=A0A663LWF0_ATHCN
LGSSIKVLEDQFDELIVETATKRKQWPRKILVHAIQTMKAEQEMLVSNLRFSENLVELEEMSSVLIFKLLPVVVFNSSYN